MQAGIRRWRAGVGALAISGVMMAGVAVASNPVRAAGTPAVTASPDTNLESTAQNAITVNGTGYEDAQLFNGVYVGLVSTSDWTPGQTPNQADFIGTAFVPKQAIIAGAFQTTVTVPAFTVTDPNEDYVIGTICAHACSLSERSLDAATPVTFHVPAVTASPNTNLYGTVQNAITVNGTGYEGAQAFNGVYVGLVSTSDWTPGQVPNQAAFIGTAFVPKQAIIAGAFQTTVTVPANAVTDPDEDYAIGTICAHACSLTNRSLDASTPVTFLVPEVTAVPNANLDSTVSNAITVNGTDYDGAQAFNGVYVGLVSTSDWTPGQVPNQAEFIGTSFVPKQAISNGSFQTTVTVPAGQVSAGQDYVIGTICADGCSLTNRSLDAATPVTFTFASAPGKPTNVRGWSGSTASPSGPLAVTYKAPADNGGSPITGFTATCASSNGGATKTASAGAGTTSVIVGAVTTGKTYSCTVKAANVAGSSAASNASPTVIAGSPAPPTAVVAKSGSTTKTTGSLAVTFANGVANGAPIKSQTATCTSSNGGVTKTGTHTGAAAAAITVAGVTTGKTYTCKVTAKNVRGAGQASGVSAPVIVGTPAPPNTVKATRPAAGQLKVTFKVGANNGAAIQSKTATCVSSNGGVTKAGTHTGAAAAPITVAGLTAGKSYTCKVTAKNARGVGLASAASNAATA